MGVSYIIKKKLYLNITIKYRCLLKEEYDIKIKTK